MSLAAQAAPEWSIVEPPDARQWRGQPLTAEQFQQLREEAMRQNEETAALLPPGLDKGAACAEYGRRLDEITRRARAGGDARAMDSLNEMRRRVQAAQFSAGC